MLWYYSSFYWSSFLYLLCVYSTLIWQYLLPTRQVFCSSASSPSLILIFCFLLIQIRNSLVKGSFYSLIPHYYRLVPCLCEFISTTFRKLMSISSSKITTTLATPQGAPLSEIPMIFRKEFCNQLTMLMIWYRNYGFCSWFAPMVLNLI